MTEVATPVEGPGRPEAPERVRGPQHRHGDFVEKVAGSLAYADDWALPGMLHGAVVRAGVPRARIASVDTGPALAVPGVRAALTAVDVPKNAIAEEESGLGLEPIVMPVLASDRVRYAGEPIAVVAAETPAAAEEAAQLVEVAYDEEDAVFDAERALQPDAPPVHPGGNQFVTWRLAQGDVDAALAAADVVVEETYETQRVDHAYLEPEAGIGWIDGDGVITLRVSTQVIEHARQLAQILGLPTSRVRVVAAYMGGGFGGKEDMTVEPYLALLVWRTRRPVRMVWSRQESLLARPKRHPFTMRYRTGATREGRLVAQDVSIVGDAGAYPLLSSRVLFAGAVTATGPYSVENMRVESTAAFTNNVPTSAMRGFGAMQVVFGYEGQIDRVADALGLDPAEVRERNFARQGDCRPTGERLDTGVAVGECMRKALAGLGEPAPARPGVRIGRGVACGMQPYGRSVFFADRASCWIGLEPDGALVVRAGVTDLGGGQAASLAQIAGEVLGVPLDRISVHIGDSALTPLTGGTFATRQLYMSGNATLQTARELRDKLAPVAAELLGAPPEQLVVVGGRVSVAGEDERYLSLADLATAAEGQGIMPFHLGTFEAETGEFDPRTGTGRSFPDYTYGAHAAEVEVDEETGQVKILAYAACHDVGRAIDAQRVEGQIQGGAAQGIGYALGEEIHVEDGLCTSTLLADYLLPTALDLPDIRAIGLERHPGKGPFGARGIGEPPIAPPAAALASAIAAAVGMRPTRLPIGPNWVLDAIHATEERSEVYT